MINGFALLDRVARFGRNSKTRAAGLGLRSQRVELDVLMLAATKLISNYTQTTLYPNISQRRPTTLS